MSRAAFLAIGSSAVAAGAIAIEACSPAKTEAASGDASVGASVDGAVAGSVEAGADGAASCAPPSAGSFPCGSETCDRASEYCARTFGQSCNGKVDAASCNPMQEDAGFPAECALCPTCACVSQHLPANVMFQYEQRYWSCVDVDGGIEILNNWYSCGPCYGAPPAILQA